MKSLIRLFRAVEIKSKRKKKASKAILEKTIKLGFIFSPEVIYNYPESELKAVIKQVRSEIGLTADQINNAFHKSWQKVKDASIEQLVFEQIVHYITTYGFQAFGIYDENSVYIPVERLEIPKIDIERIRLVVIQGYTKKEIKDKLITLLKSGIALKEDTIADVVKIAKYVDIDNVEEIKNKEVKIALCDYLKLFPEDPIEFLRYVIYKSIGKTLLIKDPATIEGIKESDEDISHLFVNYKGRHGLEGLAEVFYRFKPLFLAFRVGRSMKPTVNKIRKLAIKHHKPMFPDYLNEITAIIKKGIKIDQVLLRISLGKVNTFRKIRLAYALKYRTKDVDSIIYKIRNGKGWATGFDFDNKEEAKRVLKVILDSIIEDIGKNVKDKKIFIPSFIKYALPATEKQFTGNLPSGTCVSVSKDMVAGIHWNNVQGQTDLDLSLMNPAAGKIGWDSSYRTDDRTILFSGDITDAPGKNGATELFYIKKRLKQESIMFVNYYNYREDVEIPFSIIVAKEQISRMKKNYMVDPNNVKAIVKTNIKDRQKILGLLITTTEGCRFYFSETGMGNSITSSGTDYAENSRKYLSQFYQNTISFNMLLDKAGAIMVESQDECDIDLSPESLEKDTIIKLLI